VPQTGVHVEQNLACGVVLSGGRLSAGSGSFDQHRSGSPELGSEILVNDTGAI